MQIGSKYKSHTYYKKEAKQRLNWRNVDEKKIYKIFLTLMVCLSLGSNPIALEEIRKVLETLSGTAQVQELDEEETESEEIKKKNKVPDSMRFIK